MEETSLNGLYRTSARLVGQTKTTFYRYLYDQVKWTGRLTAIKGARGVGKTTMMLQSMKERFAGQPERALYVSLDNLWFANHSLTEVVEYHYTHGGTHLFIDEVHKYPAWQTLMKNIYDEYPDLYVAFTGSSMLKIDNSKADLSRRMSDYTLHGLSFREFLNFEAGIKVPVIALDELLKNHVQIAMDLALQTKVLPLFEAYLEHGFYPFYKENMDDFNERLKRVVYAVLNEDVPAMEEITYPTIQKLQRMLMILAERVPQTPKMNELYAILETTREQGLKMMGLLQRAALLQLLSTETKEFHHLSKPDKIYLHNPNLMYALTDRPDKGTLRETFFVNQLSAVGRVSYPRKGDFLVNHKYLFEVGGKNKTFDQIKDFHDSFLAIDDVETGFGNRIPLWMFGLLY
ncbi:MAG: AAA family ATPase [Bacteroidales bacterium]|nr:AAA family ATPase [Bacteroidales bacterium]